MGKNESEDRWAQDWPRSPKIQKVPLSDSKWHLRLIIEK